MLSIAIIAVAAIWALLIPTLNLCPGCPVPRGTPAGVDPCPCVQQHRPGLRLAILGVGLVLAAALFLLARSSRRPPGFSSAAD